MIDKRVRPEARRTQTSPSRLYRRSFGFLVSGLLLLLAYATPSAAQQASITLVSPASWARGEVHDTIPGASLRVAGTAIHPGGVRSVRVGTSEATVVHDQTFPNAADFSVSIPLTAGMTSVVIRVTPITGNVYEQTYMVSLRARTATGAVPPPRVGAPPATNTAAAPPTPWQEMKRRRVWYGAAGVLGLAMSLIHTQSFSQVCVQTVAGQDCYDRTTKTSFTVPGFGVVLAAGTAALLDYRKTATRLRGEEAEGPRSLRFEPPTLSREQGRTVISLVRIRF